MQLLYDDGSIDLEQHRRQVADAQNFAHRTTFQRTFKSQTIVRLSHANKGEKCNNDEMKLIKHVYVLISGYYVDTKEIIRRNLCTLSDCWTHARLLGSVL